ncbi:MAG TPA: enolase C-terminal domain-like protein [Burkholderiaceae bacterium]|nr:enolase C-terminal domain-like protein [Burkholderiaceae bacterium]
MAEAFNLAVCRHFLMELHVSPTAAASAAAWLEYIPQLNAVASSRLLIEDGMAVAPEAPGLGIAWRDDELDRRAVARHLIQART